MLSCTLCLKRIPWLSDILQSLHIFFLMVFFMPAQMWIPGECLLTSGYPAHIQFFTGVCAGVSIQLITLFERPSTFRFQACMLSFASAHAEMLECIRYSEKHHSTSSFRTQIHASMHWIFWIGFWAIQNAGAFKQVQKRWKCAPSTLFLWRREWNSRIIWRRQLWGWGFWRQM